MIVEKIELRLVVTSCGNLHEFTNYHQQLNYGIDQFYHLLSGCFINKGMF